MEFRNEDETVEKRKGPLFKDPWWVRFTIVVLCAMLFGYMGWELGKHYEKTARETAANIEKIAKEKYDNAIKNLRDRAEEVCVSANVDAKLLGATCDVIHDYAHDADSGILRFAFDSYVRCKCLFYNPSENVKIEIDVLQAL